MKWLAATALCFALIATRETAAGLQKEPRSLLMDRDLLVQRKTDLWVGESRMIKEDGKTRIIHPVLIFASDTELNRVQFKGREEFLKKGEATGNVYVGVSDQNGTVYRNAVFRLAEKDRQRFIVFPDFEGGEFAMLYKIDGDLLIIEPGKENKSVAVWQVDIASRYKRTK